VVIGDSANLMLDFSPYAGDAFATDQTYFRAISEHDLAPDQTAALALINGVNWAA
jgi:hypothetical protein